MTAPPEGVDILQHSKVHRYLLPPERFSLGESIHHVSGVELGLWLTLTDQIACGRFCLDGVTLRFRPLGRSARSSSLRASRDPTPPVPHRAAGAKVVCRLICETWLGTVTSNTKSRSGAKSCVLRQFALDVPSTGYPDRPVLSNDRWSAMACTADVTAMAIAEPLYGLSFALLHLACMRLIRHLVPANLAATAQAIYGTVAIGATTAMVTFCQGHCTADSGQPASGSWLRSARPPPVIAALSRTTSGEKMAHAA